MSVEETKSLAHRLITAMDNGDWAAVDDCYAPEFTYQNPALPTVRTREDLRQLFVAMRTAFPPGHWTEDEILAVEDTGVSILTFLTFSGVHRATYRGVPPTGKEVAMQTIAVSRIEGGRIVETRALTDTLGLLVTIGAIPAPAQPAKPVQKQAVA